MNNVPTGPAGEAAAKSNVIDLVAIRADRPVAPRDLKANEVVGSTMRRSETLVFWKVCRELAEARANCDRQTEWLALEEIETMWMNTECGTLLDQYARVLRSSGQTFEFFPISTWHRA